MRDTVISKQLNDNKHFVSAKQIVAIKERLKNNTHLAQNYVKAVRMIERAYRCRLFNRNLEQFKFLVKDEMLTIAYVNKKADEL